MADIINLAHNLIGKDDHQRLESFGGHEIVHGRATRFHWDHDEHENPVFELYKGGAHEKLALRIRRDRQKDEFQAEDANGKMLVTGTLDHVMAVLDEELAHQHDEGDNLA